MPDLNEKQRRFVDEYLIDMNGKQAAIRAGYSTATAEVQASRLLSQDKVKAALETARTKLAKRTEIDQDYVVSVIQQTIQRCAQAVPVTDSQGNPVLVETADGKVAPAYKFDATNVLKGAELLGRTLGIFIDKKELTGKNGAPLTQAAGVLVVPAGATPEQWAAAAAEHNKAAAKLAED